MTSFMNDPTYFNIPKFREHKKHLEAARTGTKMCFYRSHKIDSLNYSQILFIEHIFSASYLLFKVNKWKI